MLTRREPEHGGRVAEGFRPHLAARLFTRLPTNGGWCSLWSNVWGNQS